MSLDLSGRCYVLLGATGGIGTELARRLSCRGAQLVLGARNLDRLHSLASPLKAEGVRVEAGDSQSITNCFQTAIELHGRVDGFVNCFGTLLLKPAHLTSDLEWEQTISVNLSSSFMALRAAVKTIEHGGSIVLISSAAARVGLANHEAIAAAKAGIIGLTLSAAASYAPRGIRVNCVAPGLVKTPLTARITSSEIALKSSTSMHALGRVGEPEDVVSAIEWLLDPANNWVTGQIIGVDGGLSTLRAR